MKEGTVKFFSISKGFGFIQIDDSEEQAFVHHTNLIDRIRENDKVQFEVETSEKGLRATNVTLVK